MSPARILETIQELLPHIQKSGAAEEVLLKHARDNNLAPEQLVKMATTLNTARSLAWMENNEERRGATIPLIDTVKLAARYTEYKPPQPVTKRAAFAEGAAAPNFFTAGLTVVKSAAAVVVAPTAAETYRSNRESVEIATRNIERIQDLREDFWEDFHKCAAELSTLLTRRVAEFPQIEEDVRMLGQGYDHLVLKHAAQRALDFMSVKTHADNGAISSFAKSANFQPLNTKRSLAWDRVEILPAIKKASLALEMVNACDALAIKEASLVPGGALQLDPGLMDIIAAQAGGGATPPPPPPGMQVGGEPGIDMGGGQRLSPEAAAWMGGGMGGGQHRSFPPRGGRGEQTHQRAPHQANPDNGGGQRPSQGGGGGGRSGGGGKKLDYLGGAPKTKSDAVKTIVDAIERVAPQSSNPFNYLNGMVGGEGGGFVDGAMTGYAPGKRQRGIDRAVDDARVTSTLQRLMVTDPILSEVEPETVAQIYNDLADADPSIGTNLSRLRFALREAVQYGGIPQQSFKTLAETDKARMQAQDTRLKLMDRLYTN